MDSKETLELKTFAKNLLNTSRKIIEQKTASGFSSELKADKSIVTEVDMAIEEALRKEIEKEFPNHGIIGEEFGVSNAEADFTWILDPVDGTEEFAAGLPFWGTIIALHYKNQPLVGIIDHPALGICLHAAKGQGTFKNDHKINLSTTDQKPDKHTRLSITTAENFLRFNGCKDTFYKIIDHFPNIRIFRSCYGHTTAITGGTDAMLEYNVRPWDIAATQVLVEEAGGSYRAIKEENVEGLGMVYGAVFGKENVVNELQKYFTQDG